MLRLLVLPFAIALIASATEEVRSESNDFQATMLAESAASSSTLRHKEYRGFEVWLDCDRGGLVLARYELDRDTRNESRSGNFRRDRSVPNRCQPSSGKSYVTDTVDPATGPWDRGHVVPANHMDFSKRAMSDTFYVTNILPQQKTFNRKGGAWRHTEDFAECYRDVTRLTIWAGIIWGDDRRNDFFTETHSIETPDYWWKVIRRHDTGKYIAWIFPNDKSATAKKTSDFRVPLSEIIDRADAVPISFDGLENTAAANRKPRMWPFKYKSTQTLVCGGTTTLLE